MNRNMKIALVGLLGAAAIGGLVLASRREQVVERPEIVSDPASVPDSLLGGAVEEGWSVYGWYSYHVPRTLEVDGVRVEGTSKLWIRVDRGPDEEGTAFTTVPWRWTIFVDKPAPVGSVPIATGTRSWDELRQLEWLTPVPDEVWRDYNDSGMAQAIANAAAEQLDAMYPLDQAAVGAAPRYGYGRSFSERGPRTRGPGPGETAVDAYGNRYIRTSSRRSL